MSNTFCVIEKLRRQIHRLETAARVDDGSVVSSGCLAVDRMLPEGGYHRGTLIEWITPCSNSGGHGADFLSLLIAQQACENGGAMVVIDPRRQFYPPAANALGINNGNLIILRSSNRSNDDNGLYWAVDQALRCSAVAAVWGPLDHIGERWFRRFQLSAESSGTMGCFVRPASALNRPSWAGVQWQLTHAECSASQHSRRLRLRLHRCRGMLTGKTIDLEINTITGSVYETTRPRRDYERQSLHQHQESDRVPSKAGPLSVAAELVHSATRCRSERA